MRCKIRNRLERRYEREEGRVGRESGDRQRQTDTDTQSVSDNERENEMKAEEGERE